MHIAVMLQIDDRGVGNQIVLPSTAGHRIQGHAVIGGDSNHLEIGDESVSSNITLIWDQIAKYALAWAAASAIYLYTRWTAEKSSSGADPVSTVVSVYCCMNQAE
jgi:hypothetical protein